mgnify:FL=1
MEREIIATAGAPAAIGAYVQGTLFERLVFTSGQIPLDPVSMAVVEGGVVEQTEQVMKNLFAVLEAAGSNASQVLKTTCFLSDMADFAAFNAVYARYFGETPPARSCVQAAALPRGVKVEVEAIAWR